MNRSITGNDIIHSLEKRIGIHMQMTKSHIDTSREAHLREPADAKKASIRCEIQSNAIDEYAAAVRALLWFAEEMGDEYDLGQDYFDSLAEIRQRDLINYHIILQKDHYKWWSEH